MFYLDIQPYCENCPAFEADVHKAKAESFDGKVIVSTTVSCERKKTCEGIKRYLEKESLKGEK